MDFVKDIIRWMPSAPMWVRLIVFAVLVLAAGWYLLIYAPPKKRTPVANDALRRRLELLDEIVDSYTLVEEQVWKAKDYLKDKDLTKDQIVEYLRPTTNKAAEVRLKVRARESDLGGLSEEIDHLGLKFVLCFVQVIVTYMPASAKLDTGPIKGPTLDETIDDIRGSLERLSAARAIYQKVMESGIDSLSDSEYDTFRWLTGSRISMNAPHNKSFEPTAA
jgi:hypothetical protein